MEKPIAVRGLNFTPKVMHTLLKTCPRKWAILLLYLLKVVRLTFDQFIKI